MGYDGGKIRYVGRLGERWLLPVRRGSLTRRGILKLALRHYSKTPVQLLAAPPIATSLPFVWDMSCEIGLLIYISRIWNILHSFVRGGCFKKKKNKKYPVDNNRIVRIKTFQRLVGLNGFFFFIQKLQE